MHELRTSLRLARTIYFQPPPITPCVPSSYKMTPKRTTVSGHATIQENALVNLQLAPNQPSAAPYRSNYHRLHSLLIDSQFSKHGWYLRNLALYSSTCPRFHSSLTISQFSKSRWYSKTTCSLQQQLPSISVSQQIHKLRPRPVIYLWIVFRVKIHQNISTTSMQVI